MKRLSPAVYNLQERLENILDEIHACFKPGAKVTIIVRNPMVEDGNVVIGSDTMRDALGCLSMMAMREPTTVAGERVVVE